MQITRTEGFPSSPLRSVRASAPCAGESTRAQESSFDQITLSAQAGQEGGSFRKLVSELSYQVRTFNTTGKIQELRQQVAEGEYRPDARETAARMLLMVEGE